MLLVSPVGSVLTDPGPLCEGRTVVLNCTGGQGHDWRYDMSRGVIINNIVPPPTEPVELSGVQFTFSQLSPSPHLITQISFMSSQEMNGRILTCLSVIDLSTIITGEVTLAISENNGKSIELCSLETTPLPQHRTYCITGTWKGLVDMPYCFRISGMC